MPKAKAAAAPVVEDTEVIAQVGQLVQFEGYPEDTPENEQILEAGGQYVVLALPAPELDDDGNPVLDDDGEPAMRGYVVQVDNPEFNEKKKVHPNTNPQYLEIEVFDEEIIAVDMGDEVEEVVEAPAKKTRSKAAAAVAEEEPAPAKKAAAKTPTKTAAKTPAKSAGKPATKTAGKKAAAPAAVENDNDEELPDLEIEDEEVLALVEQAGPEGLVEACREMEAQGAVSEFRLGGLLYHTKKSGVYKDIKAEYALPGGWALFCKENFNTKYRKGQDLIAIYKAFSLAGITNAAERIGVMGWSKAAKIAPHMLAATDDSDAIESLLELADNNTNDDLSIALKETVEVGATSTRTPGERVTMLSLRFRFAEHEAKIVEDAVAVAMKQGNFKNENEALLFIVSDWLVMNGNVAAEEAEATKKATKAAPAKTAPTKTPGKRATAKA